MDNELGKLALDVAKHLQSKDLILVCAESCTGGWVAKTMTDLPGSSVWFERGFITYSNASKIEMLSVRESTLETDGAVSEQTVREMAAGALRYSRGNIALSISGIAGPGGGSYAKPVGTVWFAWAGMPQGIVTLHKRFDGGRDAVRRQAVLTGLKGLIVHE